MSLMLRSLLSSVLMVMSLAACATLPKPNPGTAAKLQAANASLDTLTTDLTTFYGNLESLLLQLKTLYGQPGWPAMAAIIALSAPEAQAEADFSVDQDLETALDEWTTRWGISGEALFSRYLALADRCSISEARRIGLIGRLASLQALYLEVTFRELSANRNAQAEAAFGTVEALSKSEDELNSYTLNAIGLYDAQASR